MPRLDPPSDAQLAEVEDCLAIGQKRLGFRVNSQKTMGWRPDILRAYQNLAQTVMTPKTISRELTACISQIVSHAAGCRYCQAHTGNLSTAYGVSPEKEDALWDYQTSPLFSDAERAALNVAAGAGVIPNAVSDEDFAELKKHYSPEQVVEIVAIICLFGFLNRWNDTMATELEDIPLAFGNKVLAKRGWEAGKHATAAE